MSLLMNILWLFLGGFASACTWFIAGLIMILTIVGIPWARATFTIGVLVLWPFGSKAVSRETLGEEDLGTSPLGIIGNILWFIFAGWWLFLYHLFWTFVFGITIIGIPFALQYWKLAKISLSPIGKSIVWKPI